MKRDEEYRLAAGRHRRRRQIERLLAPRWTPRQARSFASLPLGLSPTPGGARGVAAARLRSGDRRGARARGAHFPRAPLVERALIASSLARETMRSLAQHIERAYGVPYVKDLTDDQLDDFEAWVVRP